MQEGNLMVYVNQMQLDQIEYLIAKSIEGQHFLFERADIIEAFQEARKLEVPIEYGYGQSGLGSAKDTVDEAGRIDLAHTTPGETIHLEMPPGKYLNFETPPPPPEEDPEFHMEQMILQPGLAAKKEYLSALPRCVYLNVIRTYFDVIENNLAERANPLH